jgi:predicted PolB exonuclease-like 3'-5' exonuclease
MAKNEVQGIVKYSLIHKTDFGLEEFVNKFNQENIIDMKVVATLSDGSVHTFQVCELLEALITNFEVDGEEVITEEPENKKKITKLNNRNSVIKLAI